VTSSSPETRDLHQDRYSDEPVPLRDYAGLVSLFTVAAIGGLAAAERAGRRIPERIGVGDLALTGVATYKLSRLITKDRVTAFVRAPFTRYEEPAGHGELEEHARGTGMRRAVGQLLTCPYCTGQWVASAFMIGLVVAPRPTRLAAATFSAVAIADALQLARKAAETRATP
jgi:hypothetical protein